MIGQTISHYKITDKLGEGGMGVVYKARDKKLDRTVALKLLPQLTPTEEDRQRFIREAKAAAALNHPNICTIYSIDEHDGNQFIVMEYIKGKTLREKIDAGELTVETALEYAIRIANALAEAHQNGIIHRDIKPGNIMIDEKDSVKVMDFGLAKLTGSMDLTKTGSTMGTVPYMSPEQIQGEAIDHRSDIFSFGVVLYEMLTGQKPFRGEHEAAMTYAIVNEEPAPLQRYLPEASDELIDFFVKILAKEPVDRIGSADEGADLLKGINKSADIVVQQTPPLEDESELKDQNSSSDSTTFSNIGFGEKSGNKAGFWISGIGILVLIILIGWWLIGDNAVNSNIAAPPNGGESEITDRSVAVLPFTNLSGTDEIKPITRGLHVDLLTRLSNIADLQIKSRTSVTDFRGTDLSLPIIADSLGARWIVEGDIRQSGDLMQVNAQLIDPRTDSYVWSDKYRQELNAESLFAIQEEIAEKIARALEAELTDDEQERISGAPTEDLDAYHLYVQGRQQLAKRVVGFDEHVKQAISFFKRAIDQDSTFALAWAGLADAADVYPSVTVDTIPELPMDQESAARRAIELGPELAEAHTSMGFVHLREMDAPAALEQLNSAIELKPSYWQAHHLLGELYLHIDRPQQALDHLQIAIELNPNHARARHWLYDAYNMVGQSEKSLQEARRQQRMGLEKKIAIMGEVRALFSLERLEEARQLAEDQVNELGLETAPGKWFRAYLVQILAAKGDTIEAEKYLNQLESADAAPRFLGWGYAGLGMPDKAINIYQQLNKEDWGHIGAIDGFRRLLPTEFPSVREDPRYQKLLRKANQAWGLNPDGSIPKGNSSPDF